MMSEEVRDKLIDEIIKVELFHEVPQYVMIQNKQYFLMRLPISEWYRIDVGMLKEMYYE